MDDRRGAAQARRRREARRVRALRAASRSRRLARPPGGLLRRQATPVAGARAPAAADGRLPFRLRAHARAAVAPVPDPPLLAQEVGHPLPRLGHPRQVSRPAGLRQEGGGRDRRQLRRDPLGAGGRRDPARDRRLARRARRRRRTATARDPPRALVAPPEGYRARDRGGARDSTPTSRSSKGSTTTRRSSATGTPTSSSTSSTPAGTACSRSSAWRSASRSSRSSTRRPSPHRGGLRHCRSDRLRDRRDARASGCAPLVADAAERRRLGAASRAYVERVHDQERITDRLLDVYARL